MTDSARFWNRIAAKYAKQPIANEAAYQTKLQITREYLTPDSELLEIGCGTGSTALLHAPLVRQITAIDFSSAMIDIARDKAREQNIENVAFEVKDINELALPDNAMDMVLALSVLHLMADKEAVIQQVFRMLKPGGVFVTSTVCLSGFWHVFRFLGPIGRALNLLPVLKTFSKNNLIHSFEQAGFDIDRQWQPDKGMTLFVVAKKPEEQPLCAMDR
ncbi:class I SAM-dependent methyltransferase [Rhodovibrionaceae bacterium A322]